MAQFSQVGRTTLRIGSSFMVVLVVLILTRWLATNAKSRRHTEGIEFKGSTSIPQPRRLGDR
jgi:hypothetical protein